MYTRYNVKLTDPNIRLDKFQKLGVMTIYWLFHRLTWSLRAWPDFLIIGAQKGGTTSLFSHLSQHPNFLSPFRKEIKFFDYNFPWGLRWYQANFPLRSKLKARGAITGEASPNYVFHPNGPRRMATTLPGIKMILLLRNPIDRAYSHYQHMARTEREMLSFEEAIASEEARLRGEAERIGMDPNHPLDEYFHHSYLARGRYAEQITRLLALFPREKILILKAEDLFSTPSQVYAEVLAFLNLPAWDLPVYPKENQGNYPAMNPKTRLELSGYFKPHNEKLYQLLERDFGWD